MATEKAKWHPEMDWLTGSRGVLLHRISSTNWFVVNSNHCMWSPCKHLIVLCVCWSPIPGSEGLYARYKVRRVKKGTRDETDYHLTMWTVAYYWWKRKSCSVICTTCWENTKNMYQLYEINRYQFKSKQLIIPLTIQQAESHLSPETPMFTVKRSHVSQREVIMCACFEKNY